MKSLALIVAFTAMLVASADARGGTQCIAQVGKPTQTTSGMRCQSHRSYRYPSVPAVPPRRSSAKWASIPIAEDADARLWANARGCNGGVREELAKGVARGFYEILRRRDSRGSGAAQGEKNGQWSLYADRFWCRAGAALALIAHGPGGRRKCP